MTKSEERLLRIICEEYGLTFGDLTGRRRTQSISEARFIAMYILRLRGQTLQRIGELFNRSHSTVIFGLQTVANMRDTDSHFAQKNSRLIATLEQHD